MKRPAARPSHPMRRQVIRGGSGLVAAMLAGGAVRPAAAQARPMVIGYQEQPDWLFFLAVVAGSINRSGRARLDYRRRWILRTVTRRTAFRA